SKYQDSYYSGTTLIPTAGKIVPNTPEWMNKFVATLKPGGELEVQLTGDYVGKRYATYTNDLGIPGYFLLGLSVSGKLPLSTGFLKNIRWTVSATNLLNREG